MSHEHSSLFFYIFLKVSYIYIYINTWRLIAGKIIELYKWAIFQQAMFDDTKRVSEFCKSIHIYPEL